MAGTFTDAEIVAFAQRWDPYGGPAPSEIFLNFGCGVAVYQSRLRTALGKIGDDDGARLDRMIAYTHQPQPVHDVRWTPQ
jgi:hypothetical protein